MGYTSGRGSRGSCKSVTTVGATITGHKDVTHSESQMKAWVVKNGPLPIAVDAEQHWQTYTGGVVSNCNGKNSWGATWGESGYIRLAYGSNQCGLTQSPTAPLVSGKGPSPPSPPSPPTPPTPPTPAKTPAPVSP